MTPGPRTAVHLRHPHKTRPDGLPLTYCGGISYRTDIAVPPTHDQKFKPEHQRALAAVECARCLFVRRQEEA